MSETVTDAPGKGDQFDAWVHQALGTHPAEFQPAPAPAEAAPSGGGFLDTIASVAGKVVDEVSSAAHAVADAAVAVEHKVVERAEAVGHALEQAGHAVVETAEQVVTAVKKAFAGPPPTPPNQAGPGQKARADKLLDAMPEADRTKVREILDKAPAKEKGYLEKALASKHSAAEIESFHKAIEGKDEAWMQENLHLIGKPDGTGIKQQWHDSCGPTTIQAMKGELDPIYALKIHTENPSYTDVDTSSGTAKNPNMAAEQKTILEGQGGRAVARDGRGAGMPLDQALQDQKATTGLDFNREEITDGSVDGVLGEIDTSLHAGLPVPMRIGDDRGGHFVLVSGVEDGPPRTYAIHDPWDGKIVKVTDKQFKDKSFNIAGYSKATHIYKPAPDANAGAAGS